MTYVHCRPFSFCKRRLPVMSPVLPLLYWQQCLRLSSLWTAFLPTQFTVYSRMSSRIFWKSGPMPALPSWLSVLFLLHFMQPVLLSLPSLQQQMHCFMSHKVIIVGVLNIQGKSCVKNNFLYWVKNASLQYVYVLYYMCGCSGHMANKKYEIYKKCTHLNWVGAGENFISAKLFNNQYGNGWKQLLVLQYWG